MIRFVFLLFTVLSFRGLNLNAQALDTQSDFFKLGKSWLIKDYDPDFLLRDPMYTKVSVVGDTVVESMSAVRLCMENVMEGYKSYLAVRDEEGIISVFSEEYRKFLPLLNFNLRKGDEVGDGNVVKDEGYIDLKDGSHRILTFGPSCYWIEGVGSTADYYLTVFERPIGVISRLVQCYDSGMCIYSENTLDLFVTGIDKITKEVDRAAPVYDLEGRRVTNPQKGHIYIQSSQKVLW